MCEIVSIHIHDIAEQSDMLEADAEVIAANASETFEKYALILCL